MLARVQGIVESVVRDRPDLQEVTVRCGAGMRRAVVYPELTGRANAGDVVALNTWAVEMGLGTGGVDFVTQVGSSGCEADLPGRAMKLRYTPMQTPVLSAEDPESPDHDAIRRFVSLETTPVVCFELHSQLPAIAAAAKWETGGRARIVYVMTDGAALPAAFSRTIPMLREHRLIDAVVTAGQAFGGDYEAVNVYSALATARAAAGADIIIAGQGPGNLGTATTLGFSGIDQGISLNAAAALDGTAITAVRLSFADPRPRHLGLSHHTMTVLSRIAMTSTLVPLPRLDELEELTLRTAIEQADLSERHEFITVEADLGLQALVDTGIPVTTMGRGITEERAFFLAAAAAGLLAGQWASGDVAGSPARR